MLIFAIDDEPILLQNLHDAIAEAEPQASIRTFRLGKEALEAIQTEHLSPDVVFTDIRMPGISGLELAVRLKTLVPGMRIVFVTGYDEYALEAFRIHANGYLLKPVNAAKIREELNVFERPVMESRPEKLQVHCFGYFEVFWQGTPLRFQRLQTKELLAYLVSRDGQACTMEQISTALWENEGDMAVTGTRIRNLVNDLRTTLRGIGMEQVMIRHRGWIAVNRQMIDCDYYRMLDGDVAAMDAFNGQFMQQYSWAELTAGALEFRFWE